jgi:oligosaccharide repeat unit polymerase
MAARGDVTAERSRRIRSAGLGATRGGALAAALLLAVVVGAGAYRMPGLTMLAAVVAGIGALALWWHEARTDVEGRARTKAVPHVESLWWMNPAWMLPLAIAPSLYLALHTPESVFRFNWFTPKYFTPHLAWLGVVMVVAFILGTYVGTWNRERHRNPEVTISAHQRDVLIHAAYWTFFLTVVGYVVWAAYGVQRGLTGGALINVLQGGGGTSVKQLYLAPVAGITTLTQLGPVAACCFLLLGRLNVLKAWPYITFLFALALGRTLFNSERLALIEILLPVFVLWLAMPRYAGTGSPFGARAWKLIVPVWIPVAVVLIFSLTEYQRTWVPHYRAATNETYESYVGHRLSAYYATGFNNAALEIKYPHERSSVPYFTLEWFWTFPVVSSVWPYSNFAGGENGFGPLLDRRANPEFNNPGGLYVPLVDLGLGGAIVFWLVAGAVVGAIHLRFRNGSLGALILYPVLVVGLFMAYGVLYWAEGRAFPTLIAGSIVALVLANAAPSRHAARPQGQAAHAEI